MGDIVISGGGQSTVATDELLQHAARLGDFSQRLRGWRNRVRSVPEMPRLPPTAAEPFLPLNPVAGPDAALEFAAAALLRAETTAQRLTAELRAAAENYGAAERFAAAVAESGGALFGFALGSVAPLLAFWLLGPALIGSLGFMGSTLFTGSAAKSLTALGGMASGRRGILSNPKFVELVRVAVSSTDEVMLGAAHIPLPAALAVGDRGLGWFGLRGAATEVVGAAGLGGALQETPVRVRQAAPPAATRPPAGFVDLAARIPPCGPGTPQVSVERYRSATGEPRWIVYVGGTVDPGLAATDEPWDSTSNVQAIAGLDPGSVRATLQAMEEAGARPGDQVLSIGYSQGGIVATDIVTQGGYRNAGLITFGSPTGQMPIPEGVPRVAVEIKEDLIPALGGAPLAPYQGGLERILVRRSAYDDAGPPVGAGQALPAHNISNYRDTAELMDAAGDDRLTGIRQILADFTGDGDGTSTRYRATRVAAEPPRSNRLP
ncbi:MAG: hypothetical protein ABI255_08750 [Microbacteriaceae bacterium]